MESDAGDALSPNRLQHLIGALDTDEAVASHEHSLQARISRHSQLDVASITGVQSWTKVNGALISHRAK
jgi:hypothetical protein